MRTLLVALLLALPAQAQQLTLDSPCGAPGVGIRVVDKTVIREDVGRPGWHVDADGGWTTCQMPKKIWPRGCRVDAQEWPRFDGSMTCRSPGLPGQRILDGQIVQLTAQPPTSEYIDGRAIYICRTSGLELVTSTCNRMLVCFRGPGSRSSDDGGQTWWMFSGLLYDGERAQASELNGSRKRAVQCNGGRFDLL